MKKRFRKGVALTFLVVFILVSFSPIFAKPAKAQWVVFDPANFANTLANMLKDYGLDALAWQIANLTIERMAASTVNWINSGFNGSPAYVTNPEAYFTELGDKIAGQYIFNNPNLNFLCGPMSAKIKIALARNYTNSNVRWNCTLTQVGRNFENFMDDFGNGGWENFFELTQNQQNNPIGAYLQAENEMANKINSRVNTKLNELNWGKGFLSFEVCGEEGRDEDGVCIGSATIATPGSVIEGQLNQVLGSGSRKLEVADEINEIVSSLLNQLVTQAIGGVKGLRGASSSNSSGENSITSRLSSSNASSMTGYFGNTIDTSVLNTQAPAVNTPNNATLIWPTTTSDGGVCDPSSALYNPADPTCMAPQ